MDTFEKNWVDLKHGDLTVVVARFDRHPGENAILIRGSDRLNREQEIVLERAGFVRITGPKTAWARSGGELQMRTLRAAFPAMTKRVQPFSETTVRIRGVNPFSNREPLPDAADAKPGVRNEFQVDYRPASRIGAPIAVIPKFLAQPTSDALSDLEAKYSTIDDFVAERLGVTVAELSRMLAPEQVDAVALGIAATERDRDLIIADQTGLGKGRILACLALAAVNAGRNVIFMTEKANLFSDIWRDIVDVGADRKIGRPFLMNSKSNIKDVNSMNGDLLFEALPDAEIARVVRSQKLPDGCRMMLCTYSQFNKRGSSKAKFLKAVATDAYALKDEAHNAAGADSNTGDMVDEAFENSWGVARSSATFATKALNLLRYKKALPPSLRTEAAAKLLAAAGTALEEVLSAMLARDGVLIRREQDLSGLDVKLLVDDKNVSRNREYQNRLAPILRRMAKLQRNVESLIELKNEEAEAAGGKAAKEKWYTSNFGSRLSLVRRQFLTALSVEHCISECVRILLENKKPVIVVESTMEAMMRELSGEASQSAGDEEASEGGADVNETPPDLPAALNLMVDRIMQMSVKRGKDTEAEKIDVEDTYCLKDAEILRSMIADFPALSLSPIDDIIDKVEAAGTLLHEQNVIARPWNMGEISARNLRVRNGRYEPMQKVDRNTSIVKFQSGVHDGIVLTGAASTGLSLHASERAADQRVRVMLELQIARNVRQRAQFWGRIDRRGQVVLPEFAVLSTGLLTQTRILIMENNKIRSMYANVTGNAETGKAMGGIPDLINSIGNKVAQRLLEDHPRLAEEMCIGMRGIDPEAAEQELYYVNKLLARFDLIDSAEADKVFDRLLKDYADELAAYAAKGKSVRGIRELDGEWEEVSRNLYEEGAPEDGPVFGQPVEIVTMKGTFDRDTLRSDRVSKLLRSSRERLAHESGSAAGPYFSHHVAEIKKRRRAILTASLAGRYSSVEMALKEKEPNAVKAADERLAKLSSVLGLLSPGVMMIVQGEEGETQNAVIVDVRAPADAELHHPGRWSVRYAVPGDTVVREISAATLMRDPAYRLHVHGVSASANLSAFDAAPGGRVTEYREFLAGNLVKAVAIAAETASGSMVAYRTPDGASNRAVLVSKRGRRALLNRSAKTTNVHDARSILEDGRTLFSDFNNRLTGVILEQQQKGYLLSIPEHGRKFPEESFKAFCSSFRSDRKMLAARVPNDRLDDLLAHLFSQGVSLHYESSSGYAPIVPPPPRSFGKGGSQTQNKGFNRGR